MQALHQTDDITIIGPALIDIITAPVPSALPSKGSHLVRETRITFGGDALNESVVLSRFHKSAHLITKVGDDEAGGMVRDYIKANGVLGEHIKVEKDLETSVHIVLVDETGERRFLMNENGSARRLCADDILPYLPGAAKIVSFASLFISPPLTLDIVGDLFAQIKQDPGRILVADMTRAKNHETLYDLRPLLPYVDYILPNDSEIAQITGVEDPEENARLLVEAGAGCAVVKTGSQGCIVKTADSCCRIPAYPDANCIDTTGAGDTFAAGFLWALSEGYSPTECARFGNAAASCSVEAYGAVNGILTIEEPMRRYRSMLETAGKEAANV